VSTWGAEVHSSRRRHRVGFHSTLVHGRSRISCRRDFDARSPVGPAPTTFTGHDLAVLAERRSDNDARFSNPFHRRRHGLGGSPRVDDLYIATEAARTDERPVEWSDLFGIVVGFEELD